VKKVAEHYLEDEFLIAFARARSLSAFSCSLHEIGQSRVMDIQRINFLTKLVDELQGEFSSGSENRCQSDHFGAVLRKDVYQRGHFDLGQGQRPSLSRLFSSIMARATTGEGV